MSLVQQIGVAISQYMLEHLGKTPNVVYLAPGQMGVLRNELGMPDSGGLTHVMGLLVKSMPNIVVTREATN